MNKVDIFSDNIHSFALHVTPKMTILSKTRHSEISHKSAKIVKNTKNYFWN